MSKQYFLVLTFLLASLSTPSVFATQIIHYKNKPVTIELRKGEERSLDFGAHVKIGITKRQQVKKLFRAQSAQGVVHFLAYDKFDKQRIQIKRLTDGRVILLDLIATKAKKKSEPLEDIRIILESDNVIKSSTDSTPDIDFHVITPIDLTRHAAQKLYGPSRLHKDIPGIMESTTGVKERVYIFKGENKYATTSRVVLAYEGGGYHMAAIHIKNITQKKIPLSYFDINIPMSHATFQHHMLAANGVPGDSTILYLVSHEDLKTTLYPWTYYQDLKFEAEEKVRLDKEKKKTKVEKKHKRDKR